MRSPGNPRRTVVTSISQPRPTSKASTTCPPCSAPPRKAKRAMRTATKYLEAVGDPATGLPIGDTKLNLKAAIAGETHEYTDMYPGMAKAARDEGFTDIADWFET